MDASIVRKILARARMDLAICAKGAYNVGYKV